jgi:aminoglycoside/choline kinase family phosphotransferase
MDVDTDRYVLLLEDLASSGRLGNQVLGCSLDEATLAVSELAKFHAAWWDSPRLAEIGWLPRGTDLVRAAMQGLYPQAREPFMRLFGNRLTPEIRAVMERLGEGMLVLVDALDERPVTFLHADYRLDNLFFGGEGAPYRLAVIDWQTANCGIAAFDLASFISGSMPPEQRRGCEMQMIQKYHEVLVKSGVGDYPLEELLVGYRGSLLILLAVEVVSGATLEKSNERAVQLWEVMFDRSVAAITDYNALVLLPG